MPENGSWKGCGQDEFSDGDEPCWLPRRHSIAGLTSIQDSGEEAILGWRDLELCRWQVSVCMVYIRKERDTAAICGW